MIINNAKLNNSIKNIVIENGKIVRITSEKLPLDLDVKGKRVIPGLIDIHTHGCIGIDTMDADFKPMCEFYAKHGITSFLPTTMTMPYEALLKVTNAKTDFPGASILGFHFEGPYISEKYKGAQNSNNIKVPSLSEFSMFENVKMITVAPEIKNSLDFIRNISDKTAVSIGHTDCDFDTAVKAVENGAVCLTHMYNAMHPFHHRNPGPIGAAFLKQIYSQIICDGFHVSKAAFLSAYKMFGADRLILISDSIRCAGLPDGVYESGGLDVCLKNGNARLKDGTIAGSCADLMQCVKTAISFGVSFDDAVKMASETPANLLKVNKGKIAVGYDADILIVDDELNIEKVIINGKEFER